MIAKARVSRYWGEKKNIRYVLQARMSNKMSKKRRVRMHRQRASIAALLGGLLVSMGSMAVSREASAQERAAKAGAAPQQTSSAINVTTTIYDFDTNGAQLLLRSDDFNGSGQATYTTIPGTRKNTFAVFSQINEDGQWYLTFTEQSGRALWITPNQAVNGSPVGPPAGYYVPQKVYSVCRDQSENPVPFRNLINGSGNCSLAVNFEYGGILYKLLVRPGALDGTTCPSGGCPATGLTKVTCNAVSNNLCTNWTITPNLDAPLVGVANLYSYTGSRTGPWLYVGQYYNTFRINASYP